MRNFIYTAKKKLFYLNQTFTCRMKFKSAIQFINASIPMYEQNKIMSIKLKSDPQDQTNQEDWKTDQNKEFDEVIKYVLRNGKLSKDITEEELQIHYMQNPIDFEYAEWEMKESNFFDRGKGYDSQINIKKGLIHELV